VLAGQYESWYAPLSIVLSVPLAVLGPAVVLLGLKVDANLYVQIGLILLIALSAKNAILIVEFARELQAQGRSAVQAALHAAELRLRPIIMTSLAFGLGVLPLALARGAGSLSQHSIGIGVLGGMLTATFLAIFLIPMFYVVVSSRLSREKSAPDEVPA
jgi:multidrug efflux pump subunit AcrB